MAIRRTLLTLAVVLVVVKLRIHIGDIIIHNRTVRPTDFEFKP